MIVNKKYIFIGRKNVKKNKPYLEKKIEYTDHPHVVIVEGVVSGEPIICGTRIMVRTIIEQYQLGNSIENILWDFPQLSSAQVHDAISYYHDNLEHMNKLIEQATYEHWQPIIEKNRNEQNQSLS